MQTSNYSDVVARIQSAIEASKAVFSRFAPGEIAAEYKAGHDPVTEADRELDEVLRKNLLRDGEGWLSEESADVNRLPEESITPPPMKHSSARSVPASLITDRRRTAVNETRWMER